MSHSPTMSALISTALPQGHICASSSSSSRLLVYLSLLSGRCRFLVQNRNLGVFTWSIRPCKYVFIPISFLNPSYISKCPSSFTLFSSASLSLTSVLYPPKFYVDSVSSRFPPIYPSILSRLRYPTLSHLALLLLSPTQPQGWGTHLLLALLI